MKEEKKITKEELEAVDNGRVIKTNERLNEEDRIDGTCGNKRASEVLKDGSWIKEEAPGILPLQDVLYIP